MNVVFVVNHARDWPFDIESARVVSAREYLTDPAWSDLQSARIVNLCRTDRYQGRGYYVSLLAEARGHRVQTASLAQRGEIAALHRSIADDHAGGPRGNQIFGHGVDP